MEENLEITKRPSKQPDRKSSYPGGQPRENRSPRRPKTDSTYDRKQSKQQLRKMLQDYPLDDYEEDNWDDQGDGID